jgi:lipopolysaccharide/colanic/teichoic acid biosynthesis glycosyltransferase
MAFVRREALLLLGGDIVLLCLSLWLALAVRSFSLPPFEYYLAHLTAFLPILLVSLGLFYISGLYEKQTRLVKRLLGERILGAQIANTVIAAVFFFVLPFRMEPKTILALHLLFSVLIISLWRFFIIPKVSYGSRAPALLVGQGKAVAELYEEVRENKKYRLTFSERVDTASVPGEEVARRVRAATGQGVRMIVLDTRDPVVRPMLASLYDRMVSGVSFVEFTDLYEEVFDRVPLAHVDHAWLLECLPREHKLYAYGKRAFDIIGSLVGLVCAFFFVVPAALIVALSGGSPFIYHERIGKGGAPFKILKLRTMLFNDHGDPELQKKNRVTRIGMFLRKSRIDELPQLVNILRGELSFIGPRPELPAIAQTYEREIPYYAVRHLITPGLSGWAQIRDMDAPKGGADTERTLRKLSYDLYYLKHRSPGLDIAIALKTLRALATFSGK